MVPRSRDGWPFGYCGSCISFNAEGNGPRIEKGILRRFSGCVCTIEYQTRGLSHAAATGLPRLQHAYLVFKWYGAAGTTWADSVTVENLIQKRSEKKTRDIPKLGLYQWNKESKIQTTHFLCSSCLREWGVKYRRSEADIRFFIEYLYACNKARHARRIG